MTILLKLPYKRYKHGYEDRISQLPEPILHDILSLLTTKDATKTSVLSKTWNSVLNSFPILDFNQNYFSGQTDYRKNFKTIVHDFTDYVDHKITRRRCCKDTISIQKFNLVVNLKHTCPKSRRKDIERWLNYALSNNVEQLVFRYTIVDMNQQKKRWRYYLPASSPLFCANNKSLKELELYGCKFVEKLGIDQIRFSLKKLKLEEVDIDDLTIQSLLSNCSSSLEELSIRNCHGFDSLNISSTKLKSVELCLRSILGDQQVAINEAPNLRFLSYEGGNISVLSSFEASNFNKNLIEELSFHGIIIPDSFLLLIVQEFPVLEKLELISCDLVDNIGVSSYRRFLDLDTTNRLKELHLYDCTFDESLEIGQIWFSLKKLTLEHVNINNQALRSLLSNCRSSLEEISIRQCYGFQPVNVSGAKLDRVDLVLSGNRNLFQVVAVEAPNLQLLSYRGTLKGVQASLESSNFNKNFIKELRFHAVTITDDIIRLIVREFRVIEKLELTSCNIQVSSYNRLSDLDMTNKRLNNVDQLIATCRNCHHKCRFLPTGLYKLKLIPRW